MTTEKPSICFIAHNAYGVLASKDTGHAGGIEVQVPLMANWFAEKGYRVSMICWSDYFSGDHDVGGVKAIGMCKKNEGIPVFRFIHPRWTSFVGALNRADADIYYYNCGDLGLGQLTLWAKRNNKKVMYSIASDEDCTKELRGLPQIREKMLYKLGVKMTQDIVCQTDRQKQLLLQNYNKKATTIRMPSQGFQSTSNIEKTTSSDRPMVLWVGRINPEKRLEWLLSVAEKMPHVDFKIVGAANTDTEYARSCVERARAISNVELCGRVAHEDMGKFYHSADVLCSTSVYEGFPNVFLEAWSVGVPLVTTFDPDGVVEKHRLGEIADSVESLYSKLTSALVPQNRAKYSNNASDYFNNFHHVDKTISQFEKLMLKMVSDKNYQEEMSNV
ncbi:glycosyltransferase family 4 protein [Aurantivibrio plasticivorans]